MDRSQGTDAGLVLAGRYRLGEVLGRGGMGKVWRAHDEVLHRTVAVKELTAGLYVAEADRVVLHARTQKEARAAARITHPGVVTVHDVIEYDNRPWIVMQYVDGPSLADAAKESGELEPREAARIGLHVLGALRAAHGAGVLHRDVKPGNVLLARDGRVLLTDFGIAAIEGDSTITRTGELVGSIDYLAPERVRGGDPGPASDLWSLGATLYTAVEGRSPFRRTSPISTMQAVVAEEPSAPTRAGALTSVITALLRKDPADRPSAEETERMLLEAMEGRRPRAAQAYVPTQQVPQEMLHATGSGGTSGGTAQLPHPAAAPAPGSAPATRRGRGRWRTAMLVVALAALLGGGAGIAAMKYRDHPGSSSASGGTATPGARSPDPAPHKSSPKSSPKPDPTLKGVPDGWQRVHDREGFSLLVPDGWQRRQTKTNIDYTPDNGKHYLRISIDQQPDFESSYLHMKNMELSLRERLPAYQGLGLESNFYRDHPGSLWEFTWTEKNGESRHAIDQMYYGGDGGPEYALYMTGPAADWDTTRDRFDTMLRGWRAPGDTD
ncbi:serine/threonine-protein kinase [Streptomyces laculatispora]|uniref:non-specific serine/threonine protein kinase n=1 Tax=Streptomyces laculatispora TaxID=887464 RepID=A0ABY9I4R4_9ACTN|nr:serine/threonine-protein kinase [Streptomyces laculatispora]WLQ41202.1 serine/threonine-protein kinase [Streptomyces laculatispora]